MKTKKIDWLNHIIGLFVVFLGVTAGFILQNRKETITNQNLEQKYLTGFYDDVNQSIIDLKEAIADDSLWLVQNKYAIPQITTGTLQTDSAAKLMLSMAHFSKFMAQTNTYENITNSGNLNLITSYEYKQAIVIYYKSLEDFELLEFYFENFGTQSFMPYLLENFDMFSQKFEYPNAEKSAKFKNIFATFYSLKQQRIEGYNRILKESEEFKQQLETLSYISNNH